MMEDNGYYRHVNKIGARKILFMGADRELMQTMIFLCLLITVPSISVKGVIIALVIWFLGSYFLRKLAKNDEYMREVYLPFVKKYSSKFYPANPKRYRKG